MRKKSCGDGWFMDSFDNAKILAILYIKIVNMYKVYFFMMLLYFIFYISSFIASKSTNQKTLLIDQADKNIEKLLHKGGFFQKELMHLSSPQTYEPFIFLNLKI